MGFAGPLNNPWLGLVPSFVESEKTSLTTPLDKLIRLCDELCGEDPARKLGVWGDSTGGGIPRDLGNLWRWVHKLGGDGGRWIDRGSTFEPVGQEQLRVVLANG